MLGVFADVKDAAVDLGMQGLHTAIEHLGKAGKFGDIEDVEAGFAKCAGGASGRDELNLVPGKLTGKVDEPTLVGHAEERAADLFQSKIRAGC